MTESDLLREVIRLARKHGCLIFHCHDSRRSAGDNGFPDVCVVGKRNVLFAELKGPAGERSTGQVDWHYRLIAAGQYSTLWRPKDLPRIEGVLEGL